VLGLPVDVAPVDVTLGVGEGDVEGDGLVTVKPLFDWVEGLKVCACSETAPSSATAHRPAENTGQFLLIRFLAILIF